MRRSCRSLVILLGAAPWLACGDGPSQEMNSIRPVELTLVTRDSFDVEFSSITGVRELSDARVIVPDSRENVVRILEPGLDSVGTFGREGEGPGEFLRPGGIFALRADSTAIFDSHNHARRTLILDDQLEFVRFEGFGGTPVVPNTGSPIAADTARGMWLLRMLLVGERVPEPGADFRAISRLVVLRASRSGAPADTIARLSGGESVWRTINDTPHGGTVKQSDEALGFPDGWVALAYHDPHRIDWVGPAGERIHGDTLSVDVHREGELVVAFYPYGGLVCAPDGMLLVRRIQTTESEPVRYDVIDRSGVIVAFFHLQDNEEIVGSGRETLFIATEDSLGLERLRTVAWPGISHAEWSGGGP